MLPKAAEPELDRTWPLRPSTGLWLIPVVIGFCAAQDLSTPSPRAGLALYSNLSGATYGIVAHKWAVPPWPLMRMRQGTVKFVTKSSVIWEYSLAFAWTSGHIIVVVVNVCHTDT